jgi:hypothetical protein
MSERPSDITPYLRRPLLQPSKIKRFNRAAREHHFNFHLSNATIVPELPAAATALPATMLRPPCCPRCPPATVLPAAALPATLLPRPLCCRPACRAVILVTAVLPRRRRSQPRPRRSPARPALSSE